MPLRHSGVLVTCWVLAACAKVPTPCTSADACGAGTECLANRCVVEGSEPVAEDSQRSVAHVTEFAVLAQQLDYGGTLPAAMTFGSQHAGTLLVLLRFEPIWRAMGRLEQAFLLLEPMPRARASASSVEIDIWRIEGDWSTGELDWMSQPELGHPRASGLARSNGAPLRVDITHLVDHLNRNPDHDHGIALRASPVGRGGVTYATGVGGGSAPRIELYTR